MSYPSIVAVARERGLDLTTASEAECGKALLEAFERDLPLGMACLRSLAETVNRTDEVLLRTEDPSSPLGKQLIRLVGTDVARELVEERFGVALGFYNCCSVKVGPKKKGRNGLKLSRREQIKLQNGDIARADC